MKTSTAKAPNQDPQKDKVDMIPARVAWDHVDRLDMLNLALDELAVLVSAAEDTANVSLPGLLRILSDKYQEERETFARSVGPEGPATGGAA